jgi:hypothetical protein
MKEMNRWLRQYERFRNNPDAKNDASWLSSKYDLEGLYWDEIREIYIPELGICFGPSCEALRKSWYAYKRLGRDGGYRGDIAYRINKIQNALGFPMSEFPELGPWVDEEFSKEDIQLKKEEQDEDEWVENWESSSTM